LGLSLGLTTLKFFPAENLGGIGMLKALAGPYAGVKFLPTGGITPEMLPAYLALPNVIACGGSWLAPRDALARGDMSTIQTLVEQAVTILNGVPQAVR
jgi:2-dehydro-3-deoxyphosphogluconate aldolase/(4S)-4-hydroxy-2-oxoglutarate aldolase